MKQSVKFSPEVQERGRASGRGGAGRHDSQWPAIESIAAKIGCTAETLRRWSRDSRGRRWR
jgi:transposase